MTPTADQSTALTARTWHPGFVLTLVACVLGGIVGGVIVHQIHPLFAYKDLPPIDLGASAELVQQHREAASQYRSNNYGVELATIGFVLGLAFGAVAGSRRRLLSMFAGSMVGALVGAIVGYFGGQMVAHTLFENQQQTLQTSMGLQAVVWGLILGNIVWIVAAVQVGPIQALRHGLIGLIAGVGVAIAQFVVSSFLFPVSNPLFLVPEKSTERIYWLIAFPIVAGVILALGLRQRVPEIKPHENVTAAN